MTCIAVIRDKKTKKLVFGADRRQSNGVYWAQKTPRPKVKKRDGVIIAGCGDSHLCDLLVELVSIPEPNEKMSTFEYIHGPFFNSIHQLLAEKGWIDKDGNYRFPSNVYSEILVGLNKQLFSITIQNDSEEHQDKGRVAIIPVDAPYAMGCGGNYAQGNLEATEQFDVPIRKRLRMAIKAAAKHSPGCDSNCDIVFE